jgi:predicted ATPase
MTPEAQVFLQSIEPKGFLSFSDQTQPIKLGSLNVLIGANGAGKSNFIELIDFVRAIPKDIAEIVRDGGGIREWLWKGEPRVSLARLSMTLGLSGKKLPLRYELAIGAAGERLEVLDEKLEDASISRVGADKPYFYYQFQNGNPVINSRGPAGGKAAPRHLSRDTLNPQQSVLAQRRDPEAYPELTQVANHFGNIFTFREWRFGRYTALRQPQQANGPIDRLTPDGSNLGLILNQIEHSDEGYRLNNMLSSFLPRFNHYSVKVSSGTVQVFLHEKGLGKLCAGLRFCPYSDAALIERRFDCF